MDLYNTPTKDEANGKWKGLVEYCLDSYNEADKSEYRAKKLRAIKDSVAAYNQDEKPADEIVDGASFVPLPLTMISCDNLEPRMVAGLVGKRPYVNLEMELNQPQDDATELLSEWWDNELEDVVKIVDFASGLTHKYLQEGTAYTLCGYDTRETTVREFVFEQDTPKRVKEDPEKAVEIAEKIKSGTAEWINSVLVEDGEPVTEDITSTMFEGGTAELVEFSDVYIADDVDDWEDATVIRKVFPTYADLMRKKDDPGYMNIGPWLVEFQSDGTIDSGDLSPSQENMSVKLHSKKTIECIECSCQYIYRDEDTEEKDQKNFEEQKLVALIELKSGILLRLIPLVEINYKNEHLLKRTRLFPEKGKSYGTSIYEKLKNIQDGASKIFNRALNIVELVLMPYFFYEEAKVGLKSRYPDGLKLKVGQGYPVDSVKDGLLFPTFPLNPEHFINWLNIWLKFWEMVVSIGNLQIGLETDNDTTATETMAVIQEGNIKHNYQSTTVKEDFLSIIRTLYDLYYQHMPLERKFLWNGNKVDVPRFMMRRIQNFRLTGSTDVANKLIERKEKTDFYNLSANDPNVDPIKRTEELIKAFGYTDEQEWISPNLRAMVEAMRANPQIQQVVGAMASNPATSQAMAMWLQEFSQMQQAGQAQKAMKEAQGA